MATASKIAATRDLAADLALALDPVRLAVAAGITPDPWQAQVLRSTAPRILLNVTRQGGKSSAVAILADHTALYQPESLILLVSRAQRQSQELFRKCLIIYRRLGRPVPAEAENQLSLELENGSRIVSLPGKEETIRSFSGVRLLLVDEASRVPDATYYAVRPMLAVSGGRLVALSTPFGTRGFWYEAWRGAEPWERYEVPATECPRISPAFLAEEQRTLGEWFFRQEYLCAFMDAQTSAFAREDVEQAFSEEVVPWDL